MRTDTLEKIPLFPSTCHNQPLWVLTIISLRLSVSPAPLGTIKVSCIHYVSQCVLIGSLVLGNWGRANACLSVFHKGISYFLPYLSEKR